MITCRALFVVSIIMLTGNNFTHNFRALRLLVKTVIHNTVQEDNDDGDLISRLQYHATSSTPTKLWADGLIKPVFLKMTFCRAEKEADWPLHLRIVSLMIQYFFTAGTITMPVMVCITIDHPKQCPTKYVGNLCKENT